MSENTDFVMWNDTLAINIEEIDKQHQGLVDVINLLWQALMHKNADSGVTGHLLGFLEDYTDESFQTEEALMEAEGYPNLTEHRAAHKLFEKKVRQTIEQHRQGKGVGEEQIQFFVRWLTNHFRELDRDYAKYIIKRKSGILGKVIGLFRKKRRKKRLAYSKSSNQLTLLGLDVDQAIATHIEWKNRLEDMIDGSSQETLNPDDIARHDLCVLGNWLKINGERGLAGKSEFEELCKSHAEFHRCAADVAIAYQNKQIDQATDLLQGVLHHHSNIVRFHIIRLCNRVGKKEV